MKYFIGIVPPEETTNRIIKFQRQWEENQLPDVVEPHITLKAQGGLTDDLDWIQKVEEVSMDISSFQLTWAEPKYFGNDILYFSMKPSEELHELHRRIVEVISPSPEDIKKYFELEDFVPHLTLGKTYWGISSDQLRDMSERAYQLLPSLKAFDVECIRVYYEKESNKYVTFQDIQLYKPGPSEKREYSSS